MLSRETLSFLNNFCKKSDETFIEGGSNYIYKYGRSFAHALMPEGVESQFMERDEHTELSEEHMDELNSFFSSALGKHSEQDSQYASKVSNQLIKQLAKDLDYDFIYLEDFDLDSYFGEFTLYMASQNDFHSIEFMWQID